jgi:hypothetical protein
LCLLAAELLQLSGKVINLGSKLPTAGVMKTIVAGADPSAQDVTAAVCAHIWRLYVTLCSFPLPSVCFSPLILHVKVFDPLLHELLLHFLSPTLLLQALLSMLLVCPVSLSLDVLSKGKASTESTLQHAGTSARTQCSSYLDELDVLLELISQPGDLMASKWVAKLFVTADLDPSCSKDIT